MSVGPFNVTPIADALRTAIPALRLVGGAADFSSASAGPAAAVTPACFVLLATESAKPQSGGATTAVQSITARINVLLVVRNYRASERGAQASAELSELITAVRTVLLGKAPPGQSPGQATAMELVSGALINYVDATSWWQETYQTTYWSRA